MTSSFDQAEIDLVESESIWGVPGLEVDSFVHEARTFDRHLPACGKVDHFLRPFLFVLSCRLTYRWLMYGFPANFCVCISHNQLHVMTWAGYVCPLQLFIKLILGLLFCVICWYMYIDEKIVEKSALYSNYAETLVDWCKVFNHVVKLQIH
jgi:hypothetical protein